MKSYYRLRVANSKASKALAGLILGKDFGKLRSEHMLSSKGSLYLHPAGCWHSGIQAQFLTFDFSRKSGPYLM